MENSEEIHDSFFERINVLEDHFELDGSDAYGSLLGDAYGGKHQQKPPAPADIEIALKCTL